MASGERRRASDGAGGSGRAVRVGRPARRPRALPDRAACATSSPPSSGSRTRSSAARWAGVLVVQGGPGTGKTAVALHRAAYLLYTHRFPLESQGVLVVGPNPLFLRYIEQVLPSLGESGVELSTVGGLFGPAAASGRRAGPAARLKGDARMARFLARAVADRERPLRAARRGSRSGRWCCALDAGVTADIVAAAKRRAGPTTPAAAWSRRCCGAICRPLHRGPSPHGARRREAVAAAWADGGADEDELDSMGTAEVDSARRSSAELRRLPEVVEALDRMWPVLTPPAAAARPVRRPAADRPGRPGPAVARRAAASGPAPRGVARRGGVDRRRPGPARRGPGPARARPRRRTAAAGTADDETAPRAYGHIVVDEAQDLSPMQLRMLGRRCLSGR